MFKPNEIIIHCSATKKGRNFKMSDILDWHKQRGFKNIGYHFVIDLDGTVECGRSLNEIGAHCRHHNKNSIGICYIGGLDENGCPCDTRTFKQKLSLLALVNQLKHHFNIIKVSGHYKYANKACPCFDVEKEFNV